MNKRTTSRSINRVKPIRPNLKKAPARNRRKHVGSHWWQRFSGAMTPLVLIGAIMLTSLCFLVGYKMVTDCTLFKLQTIRVTGNCLLAPAAIINSAEIAPGENILAINLAAVRQHVLSNHWIKDAEVTRAMPGTITINVSEYEPLAVVDMGKPFLMDTSERLFMRAEQPDLQPDARPALPVIRGLDYSDIAVDGKPDSAIFKAAVEAVKTAQAIEHLVPGMHLREVVADRENGIAVRAFDNIESVYLGFNDYFIKFKRLRRILHDWEKTGQRQRIAAINFECPGRAVLQPASEGS